MVCSRALSRQTVLMLQALAAEPTVWRHGYELGQLLGLRSGSLYPIVMRLAEHDLFETAWEADAPHSRPPRYLYRLASAGLELAAAELAASVDGVVKPMPLPRNGSNRPSSGP